MKKNKPKLILIDGYTGAGKSTALGIFRKLLGEDFNYIKKYTTRTPRAEEMSREVFCESVFLSPLKFVNRELDFVYKKEGIYYGIDKKEIQILLENKYVFLVANEYFRKQMLLHYKSSTDIKQIFIQTSKKNRIIRIQKTEHGKGQGETRLRKLHSNVARKDNDFDYIINNDSTIDDLSKNISNLISSSL